RRVLPVLFTMVHIVLVWYTSARQPRHMSDIPLVRAYRSVAYQEDVGMPTGPLEAPPLKPAEKIAILLNLPAVFVAMLAATFVFPQHDMAGMYMSIAFVPFSWYAVGRWLDGVLGYTRRLRIFRTLRGLLCVSALGALLVSIAGLTPLYHHRTADSSWVFAGLASWSALCLAIVISSPEVANSTTNGSARPAA